jgi:hypothetical protein
VPTKSDAVDVSDCDSHRYADTNGYADRGTEFVVLEDYSTRNPRFQRPCEFLAHLVENIVGATPVIQTPGINTQVRAEKR